MANTTWSPTDKESGTVLSGANLIATASAGGFGWVRAAHSLASGKYYWEVVATTFNNGASSIGVATPSAVLSSGLTVSGTTAVTQLNGVITVSGSNSGSNFGTISAGTRICIALDLDGHLIWYRLGAAGNWNNSGTANPASASGGISVPLVAPASPAAFLRAANETYTANFGDSAFTGAVPSGFYVGFPTAAVILGGTQARAMILA